MSQFSHMDCFNNPFLPTLEVVQYITLEGVMYRYMRHMFETYLLIPVTTSLIFVQNSMLRVELAMNMKVLSIIHTYIIHNTSYIITPYIIHHKYIQAFMINQPAIHLFIHWSVPILVGTINNINTSLKQYWSLRVSPKMFQTPCARQVTLHVSLVPHMRA